MKYKRQLLILAIVGTTLLVPMIGMNFSNEVNWSFFDFIVAGTLLLSSGFLLDFTARKISKTKYRVIVFITIISVLLFIWIELAIGVIGTPFAGS